MRRPLLPAVLLFLVATLAGCDRPSEAPRAPAAPAAPAPPAKIVPGVRVRPMALPEALATAPAVPVASAAAEKGKAPSAELAAQRARLQDLGFAPLAVDWSQLEPGEKRPESVLRAAGLLVWFDVETSSFPNEHDGLLRELGAAAAGDLAGVVFEEIAPEPDTENGRYRLNAYADGKRWSVDAQDFGDWYDVDAALRLANAVLRDRGSERRMLLLDSEDQTAEVVVAPRAALGAALREGVLHAGDADLARELGKQAEDERRAAIPGAVAPGAAAEVKEGASNGAQ
ncbi:hypothetical protein [Tahibacter caeni]|uniref:hypothetical protein n=1 Tax=Tahibacter caeni TaxID=1453545 RepID=UPI0021498A56|nr:hypothetical protein [Tahibacter caeni]